MARLFDRNMFIMLFAIMIGVVVVTFFIADIMRQAERDEWQVKETGYQSEIVSIKGQSENFTSHFLKSSVVLDQAREDRAFGNYHFDLAYLWYTTALVENNGSLMETYKERGINNCTNALPQYQYSHLNFIEAMGFFGDTKNYTNIQKYITILDLYVDLTNTGSELMMLRYNATIYLMYLIENLTFDPLTNMVGYLENVTGLLGLFEDLLGQIEELLKEYKEIQDEIDEYEFFEEER